MIKNYEITTIKNVECKCTEYGIMYLRNGVLHDSCMSECIDCFNCCCCVRCIKCDSCKNCEDCYLCDHLFEEQFCIKNIRYTKEEYFKLLKEVNK